MHRLIGLGIVLLAIEAAEAQLCETGRTTRVSVSSAGVEGNSTSREMTFARNGCWVAFSSDADNLVPNDTNGNSDVFLHDRSTGQTRRLSVLPSGEQANGASGWPRFTSDGRFLAFVSTASNLVPGDTNGQMDVFVLDLGTGAISRVSVSSDGREGDGTSTYASISENGRWIAFWSRATNLVPLDTNGRPDIFVHDRMTGTTERVSIAWNGAQQVGEAEHPAISGDGRYVVFDSGSDNLVPNDTNNHWDAFERDRQAGTTTLVSLGWGGVQGNSQSWLATISKDGRMTAFTSVATNLVPGDTNDREDIFLRDRLTGSLLRITVTATERQTQGGRGPVLSADGTVVAFESDAPDIVSGDSNGVRDIFVYDLRRGPERASVSSTGEQGNARSGTCGPCIGGERISISADGRLVGFSSTASNLVANDLNSMEDIFVHDPEAASLSTPSMPRPGTTLDLHLYVLTQGWWPALRARSSPGIRPGDRMGRSGDPLEPRSPPVLFPALDRPVPGLPGEPGSPGSGPGAPGSSR